MTRNTGKSAEQDFEERLTRLGKRAYFYRFKDASDIRGLTGRIGNVDACPSDYVVIVDGETEFAEVKSTSNKTSFPFSMLRASQNAHGRRIVAARGRYTVYVYSIEQERWFRIYMWMIDGWRDSGLKSIPWQDLEEEGLEWTV